MGRFMHIDNMQVERGETEVISDESTVSSEKWGQRRYRNDEFSENAPANVYNHMIVSWDGLFMLTTHKVSSEETL